MKTIDPVIHKADWQLDQNALKRIRKAVFIDEQNVPESLEWDGIDGECNHFLAYVNHEAVATARIKSDGHIGRMAVLKRWRHMGIGSILLDNIIEYARQKNLSAVYLHAQVSATGFYLKHGFVVDGGEFIDAGIIHCTMRKQIC